MKEHNTRLREITAVLRKHSITRGVSPEKLRLILEDLGPTFIKLGQIMSMHSDILPKRYCDELMRLRSEVTPMSFEEVEKVLEESYGCPWTEMFQEIEEFPLGSASIAQVHRAVLKDGSKVVIKVQRKGIYEVMSRDIGMLHRAVKLMPSVSLKGMVDLDMVLDELWAVTKEELNFLTEASNMAEFAEKNKDVAFVRTPHLYQEYSTLHVLVMEYIDGYKIDEKTVLLDNGYDLDEVGTKLVDNYMKQVMEDGFFHADPHSGNVKVSGGKIIWIDMGMMGRLTDRDRELIANAVQGIAMGDIGLIEDMVLALGEFKQKPDQNMLYEGISDLMSRYGNTSMGEIDVAEVIVDLMEVMKENHIIMPHGLTMLARGLTHMEGILADIAPDINMVQIASARVAGNAWKSKDLGKELKKSTKKIYKSLYRAIEIPSLTAEILHGTLRGQTKVGLELHVSREFKELLRHLIQNVVMGLWVMALLISSSIISTTDMKPKIWGIPAVGALGYMIAFGIVMYVFLKHIFSKK